MHNLVLDDLETKATRDGFGRGLVEAARLDERVVAVCGDLGDSTKAIELSKVFPQRYLEMGIAEQNLVGMAAGLALTGWVPFANTFGTFMQRAWEQIRVSVAYNNANVKLVASHCGLQTGPDGATAQMLEDLALMRVLPNMTVVVPTDEEQAHQATLAIAKIDGPVYLRLGRQPLPVWTSPRDEFVLGRADMVADGSDVTIVACGAMVYESLVAAQSLAAENISVRVINMHTIKPLDEEILITAARETGAMVTAEEHQLLGGLGSAVAEVLGREFPVPMEMVGVRDQFGQSGTAEELFEYYGLTSRHIVEAVRKVVKRKI